ncbi:MAG TPA: C-type lectin domain-containing protein [Kofleriaceae bacterium]|jgi:hypothetical protein|nr:C-type lectin domain-containing protein [Kofleriaceae bacterium]
MRLFAHVALVVAGLAALGGCLRQTDFKCSNNFDCAASGAVCEPDRYCSFTDMDCASGRRYGDLSGPNSGKCVGGGDIDAGVDGRPDSPPGMGCPSTYMQIGLSAHRYKVLATAAAWATQKAACPMDGSNVYLAVPTDQTELNGLAQAAAAPRTWVGIDDQTTEGAYVTAKDGSPFPALDMMWDLMNGEPDNTASSGGGQGDCAAALMSNGKLDDDNCTKLFPAICECEP